MVLIVGYRNIKGEAFYFLEIKLNDVSFHNHSGCIKEDGIRDPAKALDIAKELYSKGDFS